MSDDDDDDDSDTTLADSTYFEENAGAESPKDSARTTGAFNPITRILNFKEYSDTADKGAVKQGVVAVDVHMTKLPQPESPALIDWQRFGPADNEQVKTEELMWEDVEIADTLVTYDRPLVTDVDSVSTSASTNIYLFIYLYKTFLILF